MRELEHEYFSSDSEYIRQLSKRKVGEVIELSQTAIQNVRDVHGNNAARLIEDLGVEITDMTNDIICSCCDKGEIDNKGFMYLTSIVAANMSISVLSAIDKARFERELEEYQKSGGTE